jgi:hypothetical protein
MTAVHDRATGQGAKAREREERLIRVLSYEHKNRLAKHYPAN